MNKTEFGKVLAALAAAYPRYTLTKDTTEIYYRLLEDLPMEALKAAALHCATSKDFFPSVHELRQAVFELNRKADNVPTAFEAWNDLRKAGSGQWKEWIEEDGKHYIEQHVYEFAHPLVKQVAELLGWPGSFPGDNPVADRAHYFKAYEQAVSDMLSEQTMLPEVRGFIEAQQKNLLGAGDGQNGKTQSIGKIADRIREQADQT